MSDNDTRPSRNPGSIATAVDAVTHAAVREAQRQAAQLIGAPEQLRASGLDPRLSTNEDLLALHLQALVGLDVSVAVIMQRRFGATWDDIAVATRMTRQSAHARWSEQVKRILDRYDTGDLAHLAEPDRASHCPSGTPSEFSR